MTPFQKNRFKQIAAIEHAVQTSISGLPQRQEPDYIAYLTKYLPTELQKVLGAGYNVASAFLHQRPLAKILNPSNTTGKKPEIGDLLLVYNEATQYNALLLQAKKGSVNTPFPVSRGDLHQLELYEKWPMFEYAKAGMCLNGKTISVWPKVAHPGAQYLVIDDQHLNYIELGCANASPTISVSKCLSEAIYDLIRFQTGRTIAPCNTQCVDHWTVLIWDLLFMSLTKCFKRQKIGCLGKDYRLNDSNHAFDSLLKMCFPKIDESKYVNAMEKSLFAKEWRLFLPNALNEFDPSLKARYCSGDNSDDNDEGCFGVIFIQKKME